MKMDKWIKEKHFGNVWYCNNRKFMKASTIYPYKLLLMVVVHAFSSSTTPLSYTIPANYVDIMLNV